MDISTGIIIIGVILLVIVLGGAFWVFFYLPETKSGSSTSRIGDLMLKKVDSSDDDANLRVRNVEEIKRRTGSSRSKEQKEDFEQKLFKAGYYTVEDKKRFTSFRIVFFVCAAISSPAIGYYVFESSGWAMILGIMGLVQGYYFPLTRLDRAIENRAEEVMYYLPLVIEQVSIGVSSSLDIGPCISNIVMMADERDSHNPVTEMLVHVEKLIKSGLNLEDSLIEVSDASGIKEVKHAFMFLSQCAKHGGEVSKQLQELADSVMTQRQVQVEARITSLPVKATGPLTMVFAGFFALLFSGLLVRLLTAFGS